jgi:hypothetical protein
MGKEHAHSSQQPLNARRELLHTSVHLNRPCQMSIYMFVLSCFSHLCLFEVIWDFKSWFRDQFILKCNFWPKYVSNSFSMDEWEVRLYAICIFLVVRATSKQKDLESNLGVCLHHGPWRHPLLLWNMWLAIELVPKPLQFTSRRKKLNNDHGTWDPQKTYFPSPCYP